MSKNKTVKDVIEMLDKEEISLETVIKGYLYHRWECENRHKLPDIN